jgi:O-acetyl-ADP-ribose deacetylase (regulator of RNase III)
MEISIVKGDITKIRAEAIVNEVNPSLSGCGDVNKAIQKAAGTKLAEEIQNIKKKEFNFGLPKGEAFATKAHKLRQLNGTKIIIHTAGPNYPQEDLGLLRSCYTNCLKIAEKNKCKSIAFPAISTGIYRMPIPTSAITVREVLHDFKSKIIEKIILVLYRKTGYEVYKGIFGM